MITRSGFDTVSMRHILIGETVAGVLFIEADYAVLVMESGRRICLRIVNGEIAVEDVGNTAGNVGKSRRTRK